MCRKQFTVAEMKISYGRDDVLIVSMRDRLAGEEFQECFRIDQVPVDLTFEKFFFVSAISGLALNNHHYIYSINTLDLDQKVDRQSYERGLKGEKE